MERPKVSDCIKHPYHIHHMVVVAVVELLQLEVEGVDKVVEEVEEVHRGLGNSMVFYAWLYLLQGDQGEGCQEPVLEGQNFLSA